MFLSLPPPLPKVANLSDMFTGRLKSEIPQCLDALVDALVDKVREYVPTVRAFSSLVSSKHY